ncbi:hypothetical protein [Desulfurobacterium sp.]
MDIVKLLETLRDNSHKLKLLWWAFLALTVVLNLFIKPHHPHFEWEKIPGAWGIFGFVGSIALILFMKKVVYPLISRPEGYYEC